MHHSIYYFLLAPRKTDFWNFNSFLTLVCFLLINNLRKRSVMEEKQGAMGVVLNGPVSNLNLSAVAMAVDIPVIITVTKRDTDIQARLDAGTTILNVACAQDTPEVVADIRRKFPDVPIIASGGKSEESIMKTINAGANAITYTPPSTQDLFKEMMSKYRE